MSKLISKIVVPDSNEATGYSLYNVKDSGAIHSSDVGVAGGVASLDSTGKVPSSQLPSYVDDVVEGYYHENKFYTTYTPGQEEEDPGTYSGEITAETGKIYVDIPTNQSYRWSGSAYIVISSPYVLPTASANTLGGVKVGDNLSIDQNGVLSAQASSPDEVQIGGNTPSSDSDIKIFIDTTEDSIAEVYTKQQQDGKFIVIKDLNAAPTESTLTYTENGTVKNFKQGDEVRVPDQDADNGYTFYKLYELTTSGNTTTATWDKLGAGSEDLFEKAVISLEQVGGSSADLIGATINISISGVVIATFTWNGSPINYSIAPDTNYTVSVSTIEGYLTPKSQTFLSVWANLRPIVICYNSSIGVYIEATDGYLYTSSSWSNSGKTANAIVVLTSACKVRMALTETPLPIHSNGTDPLQNYITPISDFTSVKVDYDGEGNTNKIIQFNAAYGTNTTSYAAPYCKAYTFTYPSGQKGCLPSLGQLWTLYQNKTEVDACLVACGGTAMSTSSATWSSTYYGVNSYGQLCHHLSWTNGYQNATKLDTGYFVRPISAYE